MEQAIVRALMVRGDLLDPSELYDRPAWQSRAACRGKGTDAFIADRGGTLEIGRALCASCTVRPECLDYAMANPEIVGLWGGTSARQRAAMRRAAG
jgi:WhiB family transcriptional regulator, redox-sensing transcriptional regulator